MRERRCEATAFFPVHVSLTRFCLVEDAGFSFATAFASVSKSPLYDAAAFGDSPITLTPEEDTPPLFERVNDAQPSPVVPPQASPVRRMGSLSPVVVTEQTARSVAEACAPSPTACPSPRAKTPSPPPKPQAARRAKAPRAARPKADAAPVQRSEQEDAMYGDAALAAMQAEDTASAFGSRGHAMVNSPVAAPAPARAPSRRTSQVTAPQAAPPSPPPSPPPAAAQPPRAASAGVKAAATAVAAAPSSSLLDDPMYGDAALAAMQAADGRAGFSSRGSAVMNSPAPCKQRVADDEVTEVAPPVQVAPPAAPAAVESAVATPARVTRAAAKAASSALKPPAPAAAAAAAPSPAMKTPVRRRVSGARRVVAVEASPEAAPPSSVANPYSEEALAQLMANPGAAFKAGTRAMQNSPVAAAAQAKTPRTRRKKALSAEEKHAREWRDE